MDALSNESQLTIAGEVVTIRPIRITDFAMENDFIRRLSNETKHYRFMGGVSALPPAEVHRLCDVDGNGSMAFLATIRHEGGETEIGVCRCAPGSSADSREIAVTVADEWQRKGLGAILMRTLIRWARVNGIKHLYSVDLADDSAMQSLAQELSMSARRDPDDPHQIVYSIAL